MKLRIKEVRLSKGLSVPDVSKRTDSQVSTSFLYEVERGDKGITIEKLCIVAKALGVDPEELYDCE